MNRRQLLFASTYIVHFPRHVNHSQCAWKTGHASRTADFCASSEHLEECLCVVINSKNFVSFGEEAVDGMAADEAGGASDDDREGVRSDHVEAKGVVAIRQ